MSSVPRERDRQPHHASARNRAPSSRDPAPPSRRAAAPPHGATRRPRPADDDTFDREALERTLRAGLESLGLLPPAQNEQRALTNRLLDYLALLVRWNRTYNLTAIRDPRQMLAQHLLDSATIAPPLAARLERGVRPAPGTPAARTRIVDVGSGAGLPGIVLAILEPRFDWLLVEPVGKKAAFLRQVAAELALTNVQVAAMRVEQLPPVLREPAPDAIVCRAFASLHDYAEAVRKLADDHTLVAAMKAAVAAEELAGLPRGWVLEESVALDVPGLDAQRHLILLRISSDAAASRPAAATPAAASESPASAPPPPPRP